MGNSPKRAAALMSAVAAMVALVFLARSWTAGEAVPESPTHEPGASRTRRPQAATRPHASVALNEVPLGTGAANSRIQSHPKVRAPESTPRAPKAPGTTLLPALTPKPAPLTQPRPGTVRILGTLRWDDEDGVPDFTHARVRFFREDDDGNQLPLGDVAPTAQGKYTIDAWPSEFGSGDDGEDSYINRVILVPGYEIAEGSIHFEGLSGETIEVNDEIARYGAVLTGRVVDGNRAPVSSANILWVDWTQNGSDAYLEQTYSRSDGTFEIHVGDGGWVSAVASHPSHGQAKFDFELPLEAGAHDFGDITMPRRTVISGTARGLGGQPLPNARMHLAPLDERHDSAELSVTTDLAGRFLFGGVTSTTQVLRTELSDDVLEVQPGAEGVDFRVRRSSAYVRISDPTRNFDQMGQLLVQEIDSATGRLMTRRGNPQPELLHSDGKLAVYLFGHPGRYSFGAYVDDDDDATWSAVRVLDIGLEHIKVPLRLSKDARSEVRFDVSGPDGEQIPEWTAAIVDSRTDMGLPRVNSRARSVKMPPGEWKARIVPGGRSFALPITTHFSVPDDSEGLTVVPIRIKERGGRLDIGVQVAPKVREKGGPGLRAELVIYNSKAKRLDRPLRWPLDGTLKSFAQAIPAGRYRIKVACKDPAHKGYGKALKEVDVIAGEATEVTVTVKAPPAPRKPSAPH